MAAEKVLSAAAAPVIVTTLNRWITFLSLNLSRNCFLVCSSLLSFNWNFKLLTDSMSSVRHYSSTLRSLGLSVFVSESITTYIIHSTPVLGKCCQSRTYAVS